MSCHSFDGISVCSSACTGVTSAGQDYRIRQFDGEREGHNGSDFILTSPPELTRAFWRSRLLFLVSSQGYRFVLGSRHWTGVGEGVSHTYRQTQVSTSLPTLSLR